MGARSLLLLGLLGALIAIGVLVFATGKGTTVDPSSSTPAVVLPTSVDSNAQIEDSRAARAKLGAKSAKLELPHEAAVSSDLEREKLFQKRYARADKQRRTESLNVLSVELAAQMDTAFDERLQLKQYSDTLLSGADQLGPDGTIPGDAYVRTIYNPDDVPRKENQRVARRIFVGREDHPELFELKAEVEWLRAHLDDPPRNR
jgi:hypothetical protein